MKRGEIWWASLPVPVGSGPGLRRPVLIIQSNPFNDSRIATVIVTSNLSLADAPGNVRIAKSESGLSKPSVINVSQIITIDRSILTQRVRAVPSVIVHRVDEGIRLALGI